MSSKRLVSLDAFRGLCVAGMIFVDYPGDEEKAFWPLRHAEWNGWTAANFVFPSFLFLAGASGVLSFAVRRDRGESRRTLFLHAARRAAILFALGVVLNGAPEFRLSNWRIEGVLQRIAISYLLSSVLVLWAGWRGQLVAIAACLLGYWALMRFVPVPGFGVPGRDVPFLDPDRNLVAWLDRRVFAGRLYNGTRDPEGIVSTIPAVATCLAGALTGHWLSTDREARAKAAWMAAIGAVCVCAGLLWGLAFPINKNLWTSSFVVLTSGVALLCLALFWGAIEVRGWNGAWTKALLVFGMNPIAAFVLDEAAYPVAGALRVPARAGPIQLGEAMYDRILATGLDAASASLVFATGAVALGWGLLWLLWRKRIFLKV